MNETTPHASATKVGDPTKSMIEAAGDAIVAVDSTGTITAWNAAAERLLGHERADAIGQTLALIIPPAHRARHVAAFHAAMDSQSLVHGGRPARIEVTTPRGIVPLVFTLGVLDVDGKPGGAVAVIRPATEPISFV